MVTGLEVIALLALPVTTQDLGRLVKACKDAAERLRFAEEFFEKHQRLFHVSWRYLISLENYLQGVDMNFNEQDLGDISYNFQKAVNPALERSRKYVWELHGKSPARLKVGAFFGYHNDRLELHQKQLDISINALYLQVQGARWKYLNEVIQEQRWFMEEQRAHNVYQPRSIQDLDRSVKGIWRSIGNRRYSMMDDQGYSEEGSRRWIEGPAEHYKDDQCLVLHSSRSDYNENDKDEHRYWKKTEKRRKEIPAIRISLFRGWFSSHFILAKSANAAEISYKAY